MDSSVPRAVDLDPVTYSSALHNLSVDDPKTWQDLASLDLQDARDFRKFSMSSKGHRARTALTPDSPVSPQQNYTSWIPDHSSPPASPQQHPDTFGARDTTTPRRPPSSETSPVLHKHRSFSRQRPSNASSQLSSSQLSGYSLYPAPTKPLPPLPPTSKSSPRLSSSDSGTRSSICTTRSSQASAIGVAVDLVPTRSASIRESRPPPTPRPRPVQRPSYKAHTSPVAVLFWKLIVSEDKKNNTIHYIDLSTTSSTLACKYGNNIIKFWSTAGGNIQSVLKISSYTEAHSRSRDYLIRSHAILCESSTLVAIATRFGRCIEIWDWARKKSLQSIDEADRWAAGREDCFDNGWCPLAVYHGTGKIDLYAATRDKKPLVKSGTIDLSRAGLPFVPQYPELVLSATSPLLVAAAGPRPPRRGHPPPDRETLLVAWEVRGDGEVSNTPYRVARPWQHKELETAIPCEVATYGSSVVSIWIPATYRAVPAASGTGAFNLQHETVTNRYVLVWDLTANSTMIFGIPNTTSCVSPDCRFVAYCDASKTDIGARGYLSILDVMTGREVWSWPDRNALAIHNGPTKDFRQFDDLSKITELAFSADGKFLIVGDVEGRSGIYQVQELSSDGYHAR